MLRLSFLCQFILLIIIGCGVYRVANQYQGIERQVNRFDAQSEDEHENIRVLQAEWAYLTNPVRLEKLARENFQLQPVNGSQMVAVNDMPIRAAMDAQEVQTNIASAEPVTKATGSVQQAQAKQLPPGVVASTVPDETTIATAMPQALPSAAIQSLPPIEAIPVSATVNSGQNVQ